MKELFRMDKITNVALLKAQIGQEEVISTIHNESFKHYIETFDNLYGYKNLSSEYFLKLLENNSDIWLLYFNDKPIGYTFVSIEEFQAKDNFYNLVFVETKESLGQSMIAILPEYQNKHYGKFLVKEVLKKYENRINTALVLTYNDNIKMNKILSKSGFKHKKIFYYDKFSQNEFFVNDSVLATFDLTQEIPIVKMNTEINIRELTQEDLHDIRQIFHECRPDAFNGNPNIEDIKKWYEESWAEVSLVAELDGKVIGCMEFNNLGIIGIPGVLHKYRKKGIGSTLFYNLLKLMKKKGYLLALADTGFILEEAIKLYERFNFDLSRELWAWIKIIE